MGSTAFAKHLKALRNGALAFVPLLLGLAPWAGAEEPEPWQIGMQASASPVRDRIDFLHDIILLPIITIASLFVLSMLVYVVFRFNAKRNPVPSKVSHHTTLEIIWTVVPILVLAVIAFPSLKLEYFMDKAQHADMTLTVTGHQWYWSYAYQLSDNDKAGNSIAFDANMVPEEDAKKEGKRRLLDTDNTVVLPVDTTIRILITGTDVIHSWFVPAFGVQEYAMPGRTNESWVRIQREGTFYGACNQICGVNHPFMPIAIQAVSKEAFAKWVEDAKKKFAVRDDGAPVSVAANSTR
jgi:cytochrome c oxidase subunit 2